MCRAPLGLPGLHEPTWRETRETLCHWLQSQMFAVKPVMFSLTVISSKKKKRVKFPLLGNNDLKGELRGEI